MRTLLVSAVACALALILTAVAAQAGARFEDLDFDGKVVLAEDLGCVAVSR